MAIIVSVVVIIIIVKLCGKVHVYGKFWPKRALLHKMSPNMADGKVLICTLNDPKLSSKTFLIYKEK